MTSTLKTAKVTHNADSMHSEAINNLLHWLEIKHRPCKPIIYKNKVIAATLNKEVLILTPDESDFTKFKEYYNS